LIGLIDAVEGYPDEGAWWLGLMLIDPEYRGKGLGHKLYQAFENWILEQGAVGVCLGVVEENDKALAFWGSLGFQEHDRQPSRQFGDKTHAIITMVRYLPKA
jgi:GNAT superfamily N-acetyltransferase